MWGLSRSTRIFLRPGATDLRLGFEGLYGLAEQQLGQNPLSGHLFLFCNRERNKIKALFWDGSGLWLCTKRLEKGSFAWMAAGACSEEIDAGRFHALIAGLDIRGERQWFRR
jgi:transposase